MSYESIEGLSGYSSDDDLSLEKVNSQASFGHYYTSYQGRSYTEYKWEGVGFLERIFRAVGHFFGLVESTTQSCVNRSLQTIHKMPKLPSGIEERIENAFFDSRAETHPYWRFGDIISRLYCKHLRETAEKQGTPLQQIDIQGSPDHWRAFAVFKNGQQIQRVSSVAWGEMRFYDEEGELAFSNSYDTLYDKDDRRVGAIRLAVDYKNLRGCMEVLSGHDAPLMIVRQGNKGLNLVFRDAMDHQMLAIANLNSVRKYDIRWTMTVVDTKASERQINLMIWALFKYSQHHHFPEPYDYMDGIPEKQAMR